MGRVGITVLNKIVNMEVVFASFVSLDSLYLVLGLK